MEIFKPNSNFDFMGIRIPVVAVSAILVLVAIGAMALRGMNFALDFTGGTLLEVKFAQAVDLEEVRERLAARDFPEAVVQALGSEREVMIRLRASDKGGSAQQVATDAFAVLQSTENPAVLVRSDFVGPQVGKELAQNGLLAVVIVLIGLLIYIGARFETKFAIAAIVATMHDVILTVGYFALTQHEFDLNVLAGVMAVVGYSINDKIVVFDRVRENFRTLHKITPFDLLNKSINQTLSRTVITSFVAFLTALALYLYGGDALKGMSESLLIGIVIGTLSSIFTACPLLLWLGVSKKDLMPKARDESELARRP